MTRGTGILGSVIQPEHGDFSAEHARYILSLTFSSKQLARYETLAEKANEGTLSEEESGEIDEFISANALLMILQSKARLSLKQHNSAA
jgi:hypothetical protein